MHVKAHELIMSTGAGRAPRQFSYQLYSTAVEFCPARAWGSRSRSNRRYGLVEDRYGAAVYCMHVPNELRHCSPDWRFALEAARRRR